MTQIKISVLKMEHKDKGIMDEVLDEIETALKDPKGIGAHQRRLAFLLSLGAVNLIENYLSKINVIKSGAKINHLWLKKKKENVKKLISNLITCPIENVSYIDEFLSIIYELEKERNEIAYGKQVSESTLIEKINLFLELKRKIENV